MRFNHFSFGGKSVSMILAAACLTLGLAGRAKAVTTPYSVDFTTGGQTTDFVGATTGFAGAQPTWALTGTPTVWQNVMPLPGDGQIGQTSQAVSAPAVAGTNFTESTDFSVPSFNAGAGSMSFGLVALSDGPGTPIFSSAHYYTASVGISTGFDGNPAGTGDNLTIAASDGGYGTAIGSTTNPFTFQTGKLYKMQLTGTYDISGALSLTVSVIDDSTLATLGSVTSTPGAFTATPYSGSYFGLADAINNEASATVNFNNFNLGPEVAVPEPASISLLGLGAVALMARRRRRA
jgi:hypothetical protein